MIVKEYKTPSGTTIRFHDAAYDGKTETEKEILRQQVNEVASIIAQRNANEKRSHIQTKARRAG